MNWGDVVWYAKETKILFTFLALLFLLFGCKSKEEKANDYLNNKEYKKAYDFLYDRDQYHTGDNGILKITNLDRLKITNFGK